MDRLTSLALSPDEVEESPPREKPVRRSSRSSGIRIKDGRAADSNARVWLDCWGRIDGRARMVLTAERVLLSCDALARQVLDAGDELRVRRDLVEPTDSTRRAEFDALLNVSALGTNTFFLPRRRGEGHLLIRANLISKLAGMAVVGVCFHHACDQFQPEWADLGAIFDLTSAEHQVVKRLLGGMSAEAIAKEQGLSINTVRTHISHAYDKLQVSCREDLWRRLAAYRIN